MIILPGTPVVPNTMNGVSLNLNAGLCALRSSLSASKLDNYHSLVKAAITLEDYMDLLADSLISDKGKRPLEEYIEHASGVVICGACDKPWKDIYIESDNSKTRNVVLKGIKRKADSLDWSMLNEIEIVIADLVMMYMRIGSDLTKELIETERETLSLEDADEKWKRVVKFYKKCSSIAFFGIQISKIETNVCERLGTYLFLFLEKMSDICIQISMLSKSSWINRDTMIRYDSFNTTNNGTLARVGVYILDLLNDADALLLKLSENKIKFPYKSWLEYIKILKKYVIAQIGFFLSIGKYQQDKVGEAIGLVNFSLVNLNIKRSRDLDSTSGNKLKQLRQKIGNKKNDSFIRNLQSVTSLDLSSSIFKGRPGIILTDIEYLFDSLVILRLKFTKENDNIKFQEIVRYDEIESDSKWPLGCKIPVKEIEPYNPFGDNKHREVQISSKERGHYF